MHSCQFVVIGAGIAGASAACELAKAAPVIILEREYQPGYHTTGRSAAVFSEIYGNAVVRGLTIGSRAFFASPPAGFADRPLWSPRCSIMIGRANQMAGLRRMFDQSRRLVPSVRFLEGAELRETAHMLKPRYAAGGVLEPEANDLDVNEIHRGFLRAATRMGARLIYRAGVIELVRSGTDWQVRTSAAGDFRCSVVIDAAGAWSEEIAVLAGARPIGLTPKRRTAILFEPSPEADTHAWPTVIDVDERFYFKPDSGRLLGSPADETPSPPCDAQPEEIDVATAVDRIETAAQFRVKRVIRKWAGLRSFVADKAPVVGFDPVVSGFFWLAAQGGYGIQTSPALARIAASLARGESVPDDLTRLGITREHLSPGRFQ
jgi:D-arginine dehydrogenase